MARASQVAVLAAVAAIPDTRVAEVAMLIAFAPPSPRRVAVTQLVMLAAVAGIPMARVTEMAMLAAYRTGTPDNERRRAWAFDFDGHTFYVLDLGPEGTFAFDLTTGMWCEMKTKGHDGWNMRAGTQWGAKVIACDFVNPIVWELDPDQPLDEGWKAVAHTVTAMLQFRFRKAKRQDSLRVTASVGQVAVDESVLRLRFSDDMGQTWSDYLDITLNSESYMQELAYLSLGAVQAPGRVFELSDEGGLVRIDGADVELDGLSDEERMQMAAQQ